MMALKCAAAAAILVASTLLVSVPADAATARQITTQGQGLYTTSKGLPENFVGDAYSPQGDVGNQDANRIRDFEHHNRYFGGY